MLTDDVNWTSEMSIQRKTYSVTGGPYKQEIVMKEEFKLPKKFCVFITDKDYFNDFMHTHLINEEFYLKTWNCADSFYFHYPFLNKSVGNGVNKGLHSQQKVEPGYTEITFQQFEKYFVSKFQGKQNYDYLIPLIQRL
jgi:hypothetical protein